MGKGTKPDSKDSASKNTMNPPSGGSMKRDHGLGKPQVPQMDPKETNTGQFTGEGQPPRMKK
jgi:hypothetical protein